MDGAMSGRSLRRVGASMGAISRPVQHTRVEEGRVQRRGAWFAVREVRRSGMARVKAGVGAMAVGRGCSVQVVEGRVVLTRGFGEVVWSEVQWAED